MNNSMPALEPPAGVQSNFNDPESQAYLTVIPCAVIVGVMIVFVFTRMYTKVCILKSVGWDDLYALGFGVHQWNITYANLTSLQSKEGKSLSALWGPTMFFTKLSLLLLLHRLFAPDRTTRYLIFTGILYCFVLYTSFLLLVFLLCQSAHTPTCEHQWNLFILVTTGLNVLNDIYLMIIPLSAVAKLQMPPKQKFGVSAVFFAGLLACVSGVLALYYRIQLLHTQDITWHSTPVTVFTTMEINMGIIVSCMPTMPALIQDIRSQIARSRKASQKTRKRTQLQNSKSSKAISHQKKISDQSTRSQARVESSPPRGNSPVELEANPARMEEAHVEPRSYFSDDSSVTEEGDLRWLS
ncbi:MAG: hypothetical protein Q9222_006700 [Ikaeria aurantiellina]